jgi:hypothetical protein
MRNSIKEYRRTRKTQHAASPRNSTTPQGHNFKAVRRVYAKPALVKRPSQYEERAALAAPTPGETILG